MSNLRCRVCLRSIKNGGYGRQGGGKNCRACFVKASGMTTTALRSALASKVTSAAYRRRIAVLKEKIATYERLEALRRERVEFLEDQIATMLDDKETYEREMAKHGHK